MNWRALLKDLTPPLLWRAARSLRPGGMRFTGDYSAWAEARAASAGYDSDAAVRRVADAARKVKRGEAADERDAVAFDEIQYSLPVLAALCHAAARVQRRLRVLDFGGALGRNYRHYRSFTNGASAVEWSVVELPALAAIGSGEFENDELRFFTSIEDAASRGRPDVVLLCSVLQYVEDSYRLIAQLLELKAGNVVVDRTPCSDLERDVLTVQRVPESIYRASYPCRVFSRRRLTAAFQPRYRRAAAFREPSGPWEGSHVRFELDGFLFDLSA